MRTAPNFMSKDIKKTFFYATLVGQKIRTNLWTAATMVCTTILNYNKDNKEAQSSDDDAEIDSGSKDEDPQKNKKNNKKNNKNNRGHMERMHSFHFFFFNII